MESTFSNNADTEVLFERLLETAATLLLSAFPF